MDGLVQGRTALPIQSSQADCTDVIHGSTQLITWRWEVLRLRGLLLARVPQKCSSPETWSLEWDSVPEAPGSDLHRVDVEGSWLVMHAGISLSPCTPAVGCLQSGSYACMERPWAMGHVCRQSEPCADFLCP